MKKVFSSNSDTIHVYAQQTQSEGRSSSVFFDYKKIYSYGYHYLLGEFLDDNTIMINDGGYSVSTAKHISMLRYATSQYKRYFITECDIEKVHYSIKYNVGKLAKANKPELYIRPILALWASLNEFAEYNRKRLKVFKKDYATYTDPKYKEIKKIVSALENNLDNYKEALSIAAKKTAAAEKKKNAAKLKVALIEFNTYERRSFHIGNEDYLRVSQDNESVETSQGIRIDIKDAAILYKCIVKGIDIRGYKIGYYTVTSINGTLKIGCHSINIKSMHEIGKLITAKN